MENFGELRSLHCAYNLTSSSTGFLTTIPHTLLNNHLQISSNICWFVGVKWFGGKSVTNTGQDRWDACLLTWLH